jgi:branched-chain amino acid transport system substrate-binding protein
VVKIGVLTDLSGVYSDLAGQGSVVAARMAIADFSKNGTELGKKR